MLDALFEQFDNLVVLDTETTGIDCKRDEIIELAALRIVKDGTACRMEEEMDPLVQLSAGRHLSPVIVNLTGITEQMLWEQGRQKEEVCRRLQSCWITPRLCWWPIMLSLICAFYTTFCCHLDRLDC